MGRAFVSYVRDDTREVDRLVDALRRAGVDVWLDRDSIPGGARWDDAIASAVASGAWFLACFSRRYLARRETYMDEELALATRLLAERRATRDWFLPLRLDGVAERDVPALRAPPLSRLQAVDLGRDWQDGLRRLLEVVSPPRAFGRRIDGFGAPLAPGPTPAPYSGNPAAPLLALDFGTTYSLLSWQDGDGRWCPVIGPDGRALHPSVVVFDERWDYRVGVEAVKAAGAHSERAVFDIKRALALGRDVELGHKRFDPVTLASLVIRWLRDCAERELGQSVRDVATAMPADYAWSQTRALVAACEQAGLRVLRLIPEPNAAAVLTVQWFRGRQGPAPLADAHVLVIDMGGGTTDISIAEVADIDGETYVGIVAVGGDNLLGGVDYDVALATALRRRSIEPLIARGLSFTPADEHRLQRLAREAKEVLAQQVSYAAGFGDLELEPGVLGTIRVDVDRGQAAEAFAPLDTRFAALLERVLGATAEPPKIDAVLLAGQGARVFTLETRLRSRLPGVPCIDAFQENAVARGLALYGSKLDGRLPMDMLLYDMLTRPLLLRRRAVVEVPASGAPGEDEGAPTLASAVSLRREDNTEMHVLVPANAGLPSRYELRLVTEGEGPVCIDVIQGDSGGGAAEPLASLGLPTLPAGTVLWLEAQVEGSAHIVLRVRDASRQRELVYTECVLVDAHAWSRRGTGDA